MKNTIVKLAILSSVVLPVVGAAHIASNSAGADAEPPIVTEVRHQGEVLDNHEARIGNLETDVADVQANTNTTPSPNKVSVPSVSTPSVTVTADPTPTPPAPAPEAKPIVVEGYAIVNIEGSEDQDCKVTYTDGTSYQWHWKQIEYNQGTRIVHGINKCDDSLVGTKKP